MDEHEDRLRLLMDLRNQQETLTSESVTNPEAVETVVTELATPGEILS